MPRRRVHLPTDRAATRLQRAATIIPEVLDHLDEQREQAYTPPSGEDGMPRPSGHSDSTAAQAMVLAGIEERRQRITDTVDAVHTAINELDDACRAALGHRVTADIATETQPRCIGDGTAAGAQCWQVPSERRSASGQTINDGRCIDCGARVDAKRRADSDARRERRHLSRT